MLWKIILLLGCIWSFLWILDDFPWFVHCPNDGCSGWKDTPPERIVLPLWTWVRMGLRETDHRSAHNHRRVAVYSRQWDRNFPTAPSLPLLPTTQLSLVAKLIWSVQSDGLMLFNCSLLSLLIILSISSMCLLAFWISVSVNSLVICFAYFFLFI